MTFTIFRIAVLASIVTLFAGLPTSAFIFFPLEINASFPHIHFAADLLAVAYFIRRKKNFWIALGVFAFLIQANNLFWPVYTKGPPNFKSTAEVKVLYSNVFVHNQNTGAVGSLIEKEQPDLVFLTEVSDSWLRLLNLEKDYPYSFLRPGKSADGNAIYSKFPLSETKRIPEKNYFAALAATVELAPNKEIYVNLVHAPAPQLDFTGDGRLEFFTLLASEMNADRKSRSLVIGDFNTASSNRLLANILEIIGLRLASNGYYDFPTWRPLEFPLLVSPIDHLALGEELDSDSFKLGPDVGSDHLPLLAKLRIR